MSVSWCRAACRGVVLRSALALVALSAAQGCREKDAQITLAPLLPERDAAVALAEIPEGALPCDDDATCDDGIDCTRDTCAEHRYCVHAANSSICSDGVFCNGEEVCELHSGCRAGAPRQCSDDEVCTIDRCDEEAKQCTHSPRDFDGDGEADWHCSGGTDCDDSDATRAMGRREVCGDGIDNDCDDLVDEIDCGEPQHDRCEDALDVSEGGTFMTGLGGATANYTLKCSTPSMRDVAFVFTLDEPKDVTLEARGLLGDGTEETAVVGVRTDCNDSATELECSRGFPGQVRMRALPAGSYFAIVGSAVAGQALLDARFDAPTAAPTNPTCASAQSITGDTRIESSFVDVGDDEQIACGFVGANDLMYVFTLQEPRDVEIDAASATGERMNFAVRSVCNDGSTTLRCVSDAPARARMYQLPAGTYYIVLESSPSREVDFSLELAFLDASAPPPGQSCAAPIDLPLDTEVQGTLANHQDLVEVQCGCSEGDCNMFRPDIVYRVTLDEPGDIGLQVEGGVYVFSYDFRQTCEDMQSQLSCSRAQANGGRIRNLEAGTYYLILESPGAANYTLQAMRLPRSTPVAVTSNDTCATATEIPQEGGLFSGDTLTMLNDYEARCGGGASSKDAVFHLRLTTRAEVTAVVDASFDSVLYRYTDIGEGVQTCRSLDETDCNDDGAGGRNDSRLSAEVLEPGNYYYVVDGFNSQNAGRYLFEVTVVALGP